jgi:hypothetical protein
MRCRLPACRADEELVAAQAQLEAAAQAKQAAEGAGEASAAGSPGRLLEQRLHLQQGYETAARRRAACLADKQAALLAKQAAIEGARAAAGALAAAEEEVEARVDELCQLEVSWQ